MIMIIDLTPLPVQPRELEIDSRTGMKNYIANGASMVPLLFLTFPGIFFDTYGIMTFLFPLFTWDAQSRGVGTPRKRS